MSNQQSDKPIDEKPDDVTDPSLDDNLQELTDAEESAAKSVQDAKDADEEADKKQPVQEYEDDPRDEIEEKIIDAGADKGSEEDVSGEADEADTPEAEEQETKGADDEKQPPKEDPDDPLIKVKVEGVEREVRQSQLVREFQKNEAADKRLQEATNLLRQAQEATKDKPAADEPTGETTSKDGPDDSSTADSEVDEKLASIAEQIQVGDTKEAVEALKTIIAEARKGYEPPKGIDEQQVNAAVLAARERERSQESLQTFASENPELKENKRLQVLMETEVTDVMKEQLKTAAQSEGYSDDDIATIDTLSQEQVVTAHRTMRTNGVIKHDTGQVLVEAKERLSKAHLWPTSGEKPTDRSERKKNAQQQPGPRSKPAVPTSTKTPGVQSASEIVAEEQQARGNPVI